MLFRSIYFSEEVLYDHLRYEPLSPETLPLIFVAAGVLLAAVGTALLLSYRKAKRAGQSLWSKSARRVFYNFALPMLAGGIFILVLYSRGFYSLLAASTLIFYGLALVNAGNFTFSDIRVLGVWEVLLGLLAAVFPGKGLLYWALGFGVLHIIYGVVLYRKYERNSTETR